MSKAKREALAERARKRRVWRNGFYYGLTVLVVLVTLGLWQPWAIRKHDLEARWNAPTDISAALSAIGAELEGLSGQQFSERYGVDSADASWMVIHQVRAFGPSPNRLQFLGDQFTLSSEGNLHVREYAEGHTGKMVAVLARNMPLDATIPTRYGDVSIEVLARHSVEHYGLRPDDPIWLLDTLCSRLDSPEFREFDELALVSYVLQAVKIATDKNLSSESSYCLSLHLYDSLSRFSYRRLKLKNNDFKENLASIDSVLKLLEARILKQLRYSRDLLQESLIRFHLEPSRDHAVALHTCFSYVGHVLELALDEQSYFAGLLSEPELKTTADTLSRAIALWYSTEYSTARKNIEKFNLKGDVRIAPLMRTHLMHSYHGLKLC